MGEEIFPNVGIELNGDFIIVFMPVFILISLSLSSWRRLNRVLLRSRRSADSEPAHRMCVTTTFCRLFLLILLSFLFAFREADQ